MRTILHICLCGAYVDGLNYQENILPKYHKRLGYNVYLVASNYTTDSHGELIEIDPGEYCDKNGFSVIRLRLNHGNANSRFNKYIGLKETINRIRPDIVFVHDLQSFDLLTIRDYLIKNIDVKCYCDNHTDYYNGASSWISKNILHKIIWRFVAHSIEPYTSVFWGTLPARVDFMRDMYGLPAEKCQLLVLGADDDVVKIAHNAENVKEIRRLHNINMEDFVIVTGGKINRFRPEVLNLMKAITELEYSNIKLIVFGSVDEEYKNRFNDYLQDKRIIFTGWLDSNTTYKYMAVSDLAIFPGLHSVMWEQAVALGVPCLFRDLEGFHHVDVGGNAEFIKEPTIEELKMKIISFYKNPDKIKRMKRIAVERGMKEFSYSQIAKKSIGENDI